MEKTQNKNTGAFCAYARSCGGCDYQGISYEEQLKKKQTYMRKLMEPFGRPAPIVGMGIPCITGTRCMQFLATAAGER